MRNRIGILFLTLGVLVIAGTARAEYTNFEVSHVHPIALTPSGARLLVLNTPDAMLEVFAVQPGGGLVHERSIPTGLEAVSVRLRTETEAWVVNHLSDTVSVVDLTLGATVATLPTGDEPTDVAFAGGRAFVSVAQADAIRVFDPTNLAAPPLTVDVFGRKPRALAVSPDGTKVYAVVLMSGNQTTVINANVIFGTGAALDPGRLGALGLHDIECDGPALSYPPLPPGITRNPALTDPPDGVPKVGLIVRWDESDGRWEDELGRDWNHCLPYRLPDHDLFVIDAASLAVTEVDHLGTTLFDVSVNPANGKIYVPHTEARNFVRFEHPLGVQGHVVDNRLAIVDPAAAYSVKIVDLNSHIVRASDPTTNLAERLASISQPGMMVWKQDGSAAYLTAIGSRKLFRVDGACAAAACVFGANRAAPDAVDVGGGPSGVALLESADRAYVLNRFDNAVAIVDSETLVKLDELSLHDPSPAVVLDGRRFLYDAVTGSGHGDAACSSCHISGDRDDLAWDLGNPEGEFAPYGEADDNVRFIVPFGGNPVECPPSLCAAHDGFDPQKGPMTTQTLRGMLEPLHWRGDRSTMNAFNGAFPDLMGTADIGPIDGRPAGLPAEDMERFRQFALAMRFPPNPLRNADDSLPNAEVALPGHGFTGNPAAGLALFDTGNRDAGQPCQSCHTHPFGAAGGALGGVEPTNPPQSAASALFNGDGDQAPHMDLKVAHMRNMYEKRGPVFGDHVGPPPLVRSGFAFTHDGAIPDLGTFLSIGVFNLTPDQVRHIAAFSLHFPTGTRAAVGRNVTLPAGTPPTGAAADEALLNDVLIPLGDRASSGRHCELVASAPMGGVVRRFHLEGGLWVGDLAGEPPRTTTALREEAEGPVSFLCATLGAGLRLGGDRDSDGFLDGDDCAAADSSTWFAPSEVEQLDATAAASTELAWSPPAVSPGPSLTFEVVGASLSALRAAGPAAAGCLASGLAGPSWADPRPDPPPGDGHFYLVRGRNSCGVGSAGAGREALDPLDCP